MREKRYETGHKEVKSLEEFWAHVEAGLLKLLVFDILNKNNKKNLRYRRGVMSEA